MNPSPCAELMCDALPGGVYSTADGSCTAARERFAASDTLGAAIAIAANPGRVNVADLCSLAGPEASDFAPVITCNAGASPPVPTDWTIALSFTAGGLDGPSAIAIDQPGNVWIANEYGGRASAALPNTVLLARRSHLSKASATKDLTTRSQQYVILTKGAHTT